MRRFRALCVFDKVPQQLRVGWHHYPPCASGYWELEDGGNAVTFGEILDEVARRTPRGKTVQTLDIMGYFSRRH
jgi:hypothetical protein